MSAFESTIFFSPRVFAYDLRHVKNPEHGYNASEFSTTQHLWAGQLRINSGQNAQGEDVNFVILEHDPQDAGRSGVFVRTQVKPGVIQKANDSSRYFAIRFDNEATGQFVMLFIAIPNKTEAFDFWHEIANQREKKIEIEHQDYSLKSTISLDINVLRPKQPNADQQQQSTQQSHVSRPQNVEKVQLTNTGPVRGRRTNNNAQSTPSQPAQPQQSQQSQQSQQQQQQQQQQPQQSIPQQPQPSKSVDIFASMMQPTQEPPKPQPQPQQSNTAKNDFLDSFFDNSNTSDVAQRTTTSTTPSKTTTAQAPKAKSNDPFDFADFDF